ncbi:tRNA(His) guanylyltransferase 1-like [Homarus americanus]|uniref:Probable tRNA(His) guanylyltransferase n=2 Tax=Homarus americanus TaxID=6706 RepID=A0A8J5MVS5_HOMAM|nr:tRNA(His) guanylyltransferase 1-like [Homarus americanus]
MAKSKFEYVKSFETEDKLDPGHWIVIALHCQNYDRLCKVHGFKRPNDLRFTQLMEASAKSVMEDFKELVMGYGFLGEFNFVFPKSSSLYKRRGPKLLTNLCSLMASSSVHIWPCYFRSVSLCCPPVIEGAIHLFPDDQSLRDYMTQRQLTCHHHNLFNTVFWALVLKVGLSPEDATILLNGKREGEQNEILFSKCNINYNTEDDVFKKGSIILRTTIQMAVTTPNGLTAQRNQSRVITMYTDFIKDNFWKEIFILEQHTKVNAKTNYLKDFERKPKLLPHSWVVVRIDGKGFHKFSERHNFSKPNDNRSIELMNKAALEVMQKFPDIVLSYGQSDEYSFVIDRYSKMMDRRGNKIMSNIVSLFAATYVYNWHNVFGNTTLEYSPAFDARVVLYPNNSCLCDYLSWRQADCHINNMYNTCFWMLVQVGNKSRKEAEERLRGTFAKDKRAILLSDFGLDYDVEDAMYRKGTVMFRQNPRGIGAASSQLAASKLEHLSGNSQGNISSKATSIEKEEGHCITVVTEHTDMIGDQFWTQRPWILGLEQCAKPLDNFYD